MSEGDEVAPGVVAALRSICVGFPEVIEEAAWVGTRWRIRTKTFAHVLRIVDGRPPAHARAAGTKGPVTVVTFRSPPEELEALQAAGPPYFSPVWFENIVGMVIDDDSDWDVVGEHLTDSYCLLAPKKLAALVDRPDG
jgi:hypothetical protein